jgi:Flp pilus assembly CpaE family ATPase
MKKDSLARIEQTHSGYMPINDRTIADRAPERVVHEEAAESLFGEDDDWNSVLKRQKEMIAAEEAIEEALPLNAAPMTDGERGDTETFGRFEASDLAADEAEVEYQEPARTTAREMRTTSPELQAALAALHEAEGMVGDEPQQAEGFIEQEAALPPPPVDLPRVEIALEAPHEEQPAPVEPDPAPRPVATRHGKLMVMFGCRGGSGATTVAVNMAGVLTAQKKEVCVVDLDLQLGDVFVALDLEPKTSIAGLARDVASLDEVALKRRLVRHSSGFYALSQTGKLEEVDPHLMDKLPELFELLKQHFDYVIVDGVRDFDDCALAALDAADQITLVVTQDVAAVRRAARIVGLCRKLKYPERKLRVLVNRAQKKTRVSIPEIERALTLPVHAQVVNDYQATLEAQNSGQLVAAGKRGRIQRDLEALPQLLGDDQPEAAAKPGFWARLFKKQAVPSCA